MVDIPLLVRRADEYREATGRTSGGVSKALFDDVRTLDQLRDPDFKDITLSRLERAWTRLAGLRERQKKAARA